MSPSTAKGIVASVPSGQTVSVWPTIASGGPSPGRSARRCPPGKIEACAPRCRSSAAITSATSTTPAEPVGDSISTSCRSNETAAVASTLVRGGLEHAERLFDRFDGVLDPLGLVRPALALHERALEPVEGDLVLACVEVVPADVVVQRAEPADHVRIAGRLRKLDAAIGPGEAAFLIRCGDR